MRSMYVQEIHVRTFSVGYNYAGMHTHVFNVYAENT